MRVTGEAKVYAALKNGKTKHIRVIVSPDLDDTMLIGWQTQQTLGMLPPTWPEVMISEMCKQVAHEEGEDDFPVNSKCAQRRGESSISAKFDFPVNSNVHGVEARARFSQSLS